MRVVYAAMAVAMSCISLPVVGQSLTLPEAVKRAEAANVTVLARRAQLSAIDGQRRESDAFLYNNPSVTVEGTRRRSTPLDASTNEFNLGVSQTFETGGQQANRRSAASAAADAATAEIDDAIRAARWDAVGQFYAVLVAQRRVELEERSTAVFERVASVVAKRRAAGEDTRLDANLASIEVERSRNAAGVARERLLDLRNELATTLQWPPEQLPDLVGELDAVGALPDGYTLDRLLASANELPRIRALDARVETARSRVSVERGNRNPDITVGVSAGREGFPDDRERLARLWVSVPLPLFKQNQAAVGQAMSDLTQAEVERNAAVRDTQARIRRVWRLFESQRERVDRLRRLVLPASVDNQQLSARSREAGQIGLLDQLVLSRQALDAERELNDALGEYQATRVELERIAGWMKGL